MKILILSVKTGKLSCILAKKIYIQNYNLRTYCIFFHLEKKSPQNITLLLLDQIISVWSSLPNSSGVGMDNRVADV